MADMTNQEAFKFFPITATGNVLNAPAVLGGILCISSSSGTVQLYDDPATGTGTPVMSAALSLVAGTYYKIPADLANGLYAVVGGTANFIIFANRKHG